MKLLSSNEKDIYKQELQNIFKPIIPDYTRRQELIERAVCYLKEDLGVLKNWDWKSSDAIKKSFTHWKKLSTERLKEIKVLFNEHECVAIYKQLAKERQTQARLKFTELMRKKYIDAYVQVEVDDKIQRACGEFLSLDYVYLRSKHKRSVDQMFNSFFEKNDKNYKKCRSVGDIQAVIDGKEIKHHSCCGGLSSFFKNNKPSFNHRAHPPKEFIVINEEELAAFFHN